MKVFSSSDPQRRTGLEKQKFMVFPVCHSGVLSVGLPQEIGVFRQKVEIESSGSSVVGFRTKKGLGVRLGSSKRPFGSDLDLLSVLGLS